MFAASKTASVSGGYQISRSLRFNSPDTTYLSRTPASNGNQSTWTYSTWIKRTTLGATQTIFNQLTSSSDTGYLSIILYSGDTLIVSGWTSTWRVTTQVFRDPSAWYHLVVAVDTTQATANNRIRVYVNGSEITSFSTTNNPTQNSTTGVNGTGVAGIGKEYNNSFYYDGYQTETYMVDGQQLTPSSFGETNAQTGVWQPKAYSGSYGTNGFYLNFSDNSNTTAATLGKDYSGNGNNWTPNNFSVTAGSGNDSLVDSPTSYGTDTGVGGTVRGNYATLNPLNAFGTSTFTNGNLDVSVSSLNTNNLATIAIPTSGKWYWEYQITSIGGGGSPMAGVASTSSNSPALFYRSNGDKLVDGTSSSYGATYTTTDIIGVAVNTDSGTITFYKNGSSQGAITYATSSGSFFPALRSNAATDNFTVNFGQRAFANTAPSGFKALCTQNLPTPTIGATTATQAGKYFDTSLYTGSNLSVTNSGFQPDFIWFKSRSQAVDNVLYDSLRGTTKTLESNLTNAEYTNASPTAGLTAFNSSGFSIGSDTAGPGSVAGAYNYVAWQWKGNGSGSTNTAGSITSTVSANTTSGFSVVTWTGTGATGTVGHGLGVAPSMYIVKKRSAVDPWTVWFTGFTVNEYIVLNSTGGKATFAGQWSALPTSTVLGLSNENDTNESGATFVAYCFAPIAGYSAMGSYFGNASADGPFIFTGFRPAYVMIKRCDTTSGGYWNILDDTRNTSNVVDKELYANVSNAEATFTAVDFTSNGIKIRTSDSQYNGSAALYLYMAFAESPFKYSLAR